MCNFAQTAAAKERIRVSGCRGMEGCLMSKTNQFWQYAKEAILSAASAKSADNKRGLLELARIWTQAAMLERAASVDDNSIRMEA